MTPAHPSGIKSHPDWPIVRARLDDLRQARRDDLSIPGRETRFPERAAESNAVIMGVIIALIAVSMLAMILANLPHGVSQ